LYSNPCISSISRQKVAESLKRKKQKPTDGKSTKAEEYLNSILPPREYTKDGKLYIQYVSATPATKGDVINLQENLDRKLQQRKARETGICPIREELYSQCFGNCRIEV